MPPSLRVTRPSWAIPFRSAESKTSERPVTPEHIVQQWFVDNAHVYMNPGSSFGTGGAGHMRMNLGTSRKLVQLAMDNMAEAMDKL